jgi:hypothetical protein
MKYSGPPATLGSTGADSRMEPGLRPSGRAYPAAMAERYGADTSVPDWQKRLICSRRGGREVDFVLTGARR